MTIALATFVRWDAAPVAKLSYHTFAFRDMKLADQPKKQNCVVCELHFEYCYIQRDCTHVIDGKEVRIARGVP